MLKTFLGLRMNEIKYGEIFESPSRFASASSFDRLLEYDAGHEPLMVCHLGEDRLISFDRIIADAI
jgi:hypothetical protein